MNYSFNDERSEITMFCEGDSVRAYNYFGAHFEERGGKSGVLFRVWAPNAESVSVVGDFSGWNSDDGVMNRCDEIAWELFVEGAEEGQSYQFSILTKSGERILKADPFAFFAQVQPKRASRIYSLSGYSWGDGEWMDSRRGKDWLKEPMNLYEVHLGSWKQNEDGSFYSYRQYADELTEYVKDMHYTHVQLMPMMEFPFDGSWGYQTTGYFAPTSRFGEPKDFMYLVDRLHQAGIGVILDWVPSNFPKDDFALAKFDGTALFEDEDPKLGERPSWDTCLFNFAKPEVLSFLVSCALFWLDTYHLDGLRVGSLSSMLYLDYGKTAGEWEPNKYGGKENLEAIEFVKRLNTAVHMYHPEALMFAEEKTSWSKITHKIEEGGMGFDYKWNGGWMNDMINYMTLDPQWRPLNHDNLTYSFFYAFSEHFLLPLSHDEVSRDKGLLVSGIESTNLDRFAEYRAFITYMYAHPGKKLVFMGAETGQVINWEYSVPVSWSVLENEKNRQLQHFFRELNKFYLENRPFFERDASWKGFDWIHHDDYTNSVIAFKRTDEDDNEIIAVCNFRPIKHEKYVIGVSKNAVYAEVFSSDRVEFGGSGIVNGDEIRPVPRKIHGCNQGLPLTLPPMGVIYLKCAGENV